MGITEESRGKRVRSKPPRYHTVTEELRRQMTEGRLSAGVKLPALRKLAEDLKVSTNTIRGAIRVLEREGYVYNVPAVGAFVSPTYPRRSATAHLTVALVTLDIGGAFELSIARGIERGCQERGWGLQILDSRFDLHLEARNLSRLNQAGSRGAIILATGVHHNIEALFKLKLANYPFVLIDRGIPGLKVDLVESDHEKGAYLATHHLLEHGHRRVIMVTEPPLVSSIAARIQGYEQALIDAGLEPRREWKIFAGGRLASRGTREGQGWQGGYEAVLPLLKCLEPPVAIFAHNNFTAWGVFEACRELGLRIPEDVSMVSFDDSDIAQAMTPPLTIIAQRVHEIGLTAVSLLERRMQMGSDGGEPQHILVDVDLVKRRSVASPSRG
jgi:DNA-binding LacI/PurR family transcriptional regulator